MKKILNYSFIFCVTLLVLNILLGLSSIFPSELIEQHIRETAETLESEGGLYDLPSLFTATANDNYTDALIVNECISIDSSTPIESYMKVRKNYNPEITQRILTDNEGEGKTLQGTEKFDTVGELNEFLNGNIDTSVEYARYWHGYLILYRTALLFFNISQIRAIQLIIYIILFIYTLYLVKKKIDTTTMLALAIALIGTNYFHVSYSLECSPVFIIMMIFLCVLLKRIEKIQYFYYYVFVVGIITNFFDYLTVPLITIAIPLYMYILYLQKNKNSSLKEIMIIIVKSFLVWGIAYALTWFAKWIIYDIAFEGNVLESAINQVIYRTQRNNTLRQNTTVFDRIWLFIMVIITPLMIYITVYLIINFAIKRRKLEDIKKYLKQIMPIIIIAVTPILWYIVLANHTILHVHFVYRHIIILMLGIQICVNNLYITEEEQNIP